VCGRRRRHDRQVLVAHPGHAKRTSGRAAPCAIDGSSRLVGGLVPFFLFATAFEVLPILVLVRSSLTDEGGLGLGTSAGHSRR